MNPNILLTADPDEELAIRGKFQPGAEALGSSGPVASNPVAQPSMDSPGAGALLMGGDSAPAAPQQVAAAPQAPPRSAPPGAQALAGRQPTGQSPTGAEDPQAQGEYPDWMTEDDKKFAEMSRKAARNYQSRVQQRREGRVRMRQYESLAKQRDTVRGKMETLAGVLKSTPEHYMEEDGKTYNKAGLEIIKQLGKLREDFKRIKSKESDMLKGLQSSGFQVPQGKDELSDDDIAALQSHDDEAFDQFISNGFNGALAYAYDRE
jgi:hypothetical protein